MLFAELLCRALLASTVEKRANVHLIAASAITFNTLVFVGMIKSLNSSVTLAAFEPTRALIPSNTVLEGLTVLRGVLEQIRRTPEIACVVRVDARLGVMAVFLSRAPACLVVEHEKDVAFFLCIDIIQSLVHVTELEQALRHKVILDALILKVPIHHFNEIQVRKCEAV